MTALQCPRCGRQFNPRREVAPTAKLRCPCGTLFSAEAARGDDAADAVDASAAPGGSGYTPSILASAGMRGVRQALEERADEARPSVFMNVVLPVMLLVAGLAVQSAICLTQVRPIGHALLLLAAAVAVQVLLLGPVLFVTMLLAMKWFAIELGHVGSLAGKLLAVTLGPGAAADAFLAAALIGADFEPSFIIAGFAVYMNLLGWPLAIMYGMNVAETTAVAGMNFVARTVAVFIGVSIAASALNLG